MNSNITLVTSLEEENVWIPDLKVKKKSSDERALYIIINLTSWRNGASRKELISRNVKV